MNEKNSEMTLVWKFFCRDVMIGLSEEAERYGETPEAQALIAKMIESVERRLLLYDKFFEMNNTIMTLEQIIIKLKEMIGEEINIEVNLNERITVLNNLYLIILYILILDSIKYSGCSNEELIILIEVYGRYIVFTDNGKAIKDRYTLFTGPGSGLAIIKKLAKKAGLSIKETGVPKKGACFKIPF